MAPKGFITLTVSNETGLVKRRFAIQHIVSYYSTTSLGGRIITVIETTNDVDPDSFPIAVNEPVYCIDDLLEEAQKNG